MSTPATGREGTTEDLRGAFMELLGAERRLRGRDQHRHGGLSHAQVRTLVLLERENVTTAGQLARCAELSPASMTAMLDQLERDGLVTRARSAEDRRQVIVELTERGRETLASKRALWVGKWMQELDGYSEDELRAAIRVMRTVAEFLDTLGREPQPPQPGAATAT